MALRRGRGAWCLASGVQALMVGEGEGLMAGGGTQQTEGGSWGQRQLRGGEA